MIKVEHIEVFNFEGAIRGMRNPMNRKELMQMQIVIDIPEESFEAIKNKHFAFHDDIHDLFSWIANGTPLPKGHGALKDENYLLNLLRCEDYETCTWRNCSECNREKCLKKHHIIDALSIIEADKAESKEKDDIEAMLDHLWNDIADEESEG